MIVGQQKSLDDIWRMIAPFSRVLVVGCNECMAAAHAGGEAEVAELASALRIRARNEGRELEVFEFTPKRLCEPEYVAEVLAEVARCKADLVLSLACGVGVNSVADQAADLFVLPAVDTLFMGTGAEHGVWLEYCAGCGECVLEYTGGLCPVARCSKGLMAGPCGGTRDDGSCEVSPDVPCVWKLILERATRLGTRERLLEMPLFKNWSKSSSGSPRRLVREDLRIPTEDCKEGDTR
ncbi:MAG: methylenetetrahydrofolate reductase C-terminal domain-containing protein [Planctomycetes bacterium]|nr:methylenetetrahydrofolate reductase C-terminal domain-containing protein [Planctomycetota bacterium]